MSYDFVFVHGTGVREPAYTAAFSRIESELISRRPGVSVHRCYWGKDFGTRLNKGGASIPGFETKRAANADPDDAEYTVNLWSLLYQDPLFELRILSLRDSSAGFVPGAGMGQDLDQAMHGVALSDALTAHFEKANLARVLEDARATILAEADYQQFIQSVQDPIADYRIALARAWVAECVVLAEADGGSGSVFLSAALRDELVDGLIIALGGRDRFVLDWAKSKLIGVVKRVGTNRIDRQRGAISEIGSGAAGDVLMYQARGSGVRRFIRDTIEALPGPVVIIAHSLGGIAAVDMLIEAPISGPKLKLLVTVGSQAPVLYELNALVSMPFDVKATLPPHFPPWLNLYDEHDFLSYKASGIFAATDERVKNGQPFPQSHSAYWANSEVWDQILSRLS